MPNNVKKICILMLSVLIAIPLYIILHEFGHTIVILSAGGKITEFSILTAHVSSTGGNYTNLSDLWLNANGALLPVIVSFVYILLYKRNCQNMFYRMFSYIFSLMPICSLFAWVIIPFVYMQGNAPAGDDVSKFLYNFSHDFYPLLVSAAAVLIISAGIILIMKKDIFKNFISEMKK